MPDDPHGKITAKEDWNVGEMLTADWSNTVAHLANRNASMPFNLGVQRSVNIGGVNYTSQDPPDIGIPFWNGDSHQIPSYGCVLITNFKSVPGGGYPSCHQPNTYGCQYNALLNGSGQVDGSSLGNAQFPNRPMIAVYDSSDGTPAYGDFWGPRSGTYKLKKNTGGFFMLGVYDSTNNYALVIPFPMLSVRGTIASDAAPDSTSTLTTTIAPSQTISGVKNASDCTLKSGGGTKIHRAVYDWDVPGWEFDVGRTV